VFVTLIPLIVIAARTTNPLRSAIAVFIACTPGFAFHHYWLKDVTLIGTPMLVMYLSLYPVIYVRLLAFMNARLGWRGVVLGAFILWPAIDFFRGELFAQGYPWYLLGELFPYPHIAGTYFASFLLSSFNTVLACGVVPIFREQFQRHPKIYFPSALLIAAGLLLMALPQSSTPHESSTLRVAVVQTNVPQSNKMRGTIEEQVRNFDRFIELTLRASQAEPTPDLIVWPETMVPVFWGLNDESYNTELREGISVPINTPDGPRQLPSTFFRDELVSLQSAMGIPMLVGATAVEGLAFTADEAGKLSIDFDKRFNSVFLIKDGEVQAERYDKIKLTPFGEVMPYISNWAWLEKQLLALGAQGMSFDLRSGNARTIFEVPNAEGEIYRIATPICFEITYAETCRRLVFEDGERRADEIGRASCRERV